MVTKPPSQANLTPMQIPTQVGLSRANIEAIIQTWMIARYKLKPGERQFTFKWTDFEHELIIMMVK